MNNKNKYGYEIDVPMKNLDLVAKLNEYANWIDYDKNYRYFGFNENYSNTYLYSEMEQFTLYIHGYDENKIIQFAYTDLNDGEELILSYEEMIKELNLTPNMGLIGATDKINKYFSDWQDRKDNLTDGE